MPSQRRFLSLVAIAGALGLFAACGGEQEDGGHGQGTDAAAPGAMFEDCKDDPRVDAYVAGMQETSVAGRFLVKLLSSEPGPPTKGNNTWTIEVTDAAAAPQPGMSVVVDPFMPDHGHGTSVEAVVEPLGQPGQYRLSPVNLFMDGVWEVRLLLSSPAGTQDTATFNLCIAG